LPRCGWTGEIASWQPIQTSRWHAMNTIRR